MPFFFIVPVWIFCMVVGLLLCCFKRVRFLSAYLILSSTGGMVLSFTFSTFLLLIAPRLVRNTQSAWVGLMLIASYVAAIGFGGLLGVLGSFLAARKMNQWLRWT